jgi:hypothetical protein
MFIGNVIAIMFLTCQIVFQRAEIKPRKACVNEETNGTTVFNFSPIALLLGPAREVRYIF